MNTFDQNTSVSSQPALSQPLPFHNKAVLSAAAPVFHPSKQQHAAAAPARNATILENKEDASQNSNVKTIPITTPVAMIKKDPSTPIKAEIRKFIFTVAPNFR
jgi:hypothetical protein